MREVLLWDNFFNNKEQIKTSDYFLLNNDLKQKKLFQAKDNIKNFMNNYIYKEHLCGTNKESFKDVNNDFSFWHYHCEPYNINLLNFYSGKNCFDSKKTIFLKSLCNDCIELNSKIGRESSHVIYYLKFHKTETLGIVGYATKHIPFPKIDSDTIQAVMKAKKEHFNKKDL